MGFGLLITSGSGHVVILWLKGDYHRPNDAHHYVHNRDNAGHQSLQMVELRQFNLPLSFVWIYSQNLCLLLLRQFLT
jgi:hypothetical protein